MTPSAASAIIAGLAVIAWGALYVYVEQSAKRQRTALLRWRSKLSQLHEDHMTARDAWTRQGNAKHTHRHARVVEAAKAIMAHLEAMPLPARVDR